jgi:hypothetical protein
MDRSGDCPVAEILAGNRRSGSALSPQHILDDMAEPTVLMVEDNPSDVYLVTEALAMTSPPGSSHADGECNSLPEQNNDRPALIILM